MGQEFQEPGSREQVLSFLEDHPDKPIAEVAKKFGISEKSIRAWKAHQTRGTYRSAAINKSKEQEIFPVHNKKDEFPGRKIKSEKRANDLDGKAWLRYSISVWNDIRKTKEEINLNHPAMFPSQLPKRLIEMFMHKDMKAILDPFLGSGSTLIAAMELNKEAIGNEIEMVFAEQMKASILDIKYFPPAFQDGR